MLAGSTRVWPFPQVTQQPQPLGLDDGTIDLVQIAPRDADAFLIKLRTRQPNHPRVVELLHQIRSALLDDLDAHADAGHIAVDFTCVAAPEETGWFTVLLVPLAWMTVRKSSTTGAPAEVRVWHVVRCTNVQRLAAYSPSVRPT
mgnify:CR=1 FL=1